MREVKKDTWRGGGISWLWGLPENHPFQPAFLMHDDAADRPGGIDEIDDRIFYLQMLSIARKFSGLRKLSLLAQARLYHSLAVAWRLTARRK